jgi:hypothetical protein
MCHGGEQTRAQRCRTGPPPAPGLYQFPPPSGYKQKAMYLGPGDYDTGCSQHFGYFLPRLTDTS